MEYKLDIINRFGDANNSAYTIFQKNAATDMNVQSIAWEAVHNLGYNHPFVYPMNFEADVKNFDAEFKAAHNLGNCGNYPFVVYSMNFEVGAKNSGSN
ncbi:MAG: hypothetical protein ACXV74_09325 [Methylobacter sp.]